MARARLTPELAAGLAARLGAGVSIADAARASSLHPKTLARWLARGQREDAGVYAALVATVGEASRVQAEQAGERSDVELDEGEARLILSRLARGGSVPALRLFVERFLRPAEPVRPGASDAASLLAEMDELAAKRSKRG